MDCQQVNPMLSELLDGHVVEAERKEMLAHTNCCSECHAHLEQLRLLRASVRALPRGPVPEDTQVHLRIIASREAARRRRYAGALGRIRAWATNFAFHANSLMKPLAIPAAGGLASAVVLFSMMMTNFEGIVTAQANDVPTVLATGASVKSSLEFGFAADQITLDVYVDEQGRVVDYAFPEGYRDFSTEAMRRKLENSLLFTRFTPATTFGQPTAGWVRVSFRRSEIDVRG